MANARHEKYTPQQRPSLAAKEQDSSHGSLCRMHGSIDVDELHGSLAVVSCHAVAVEIEIEIEPLPRFASWMSANGT